MDAQGNYLPPPLDFESHSKLDWGFGPTGAEAVITGSDVLVMKGEKIGALYAFIDPPKK